VNDLPARPRVHADCALSARWTEGAGMRGWTQERETARESGLGSPFSSPFRRSRARLASSSSSSSRGCRFGNALTNLLDGRSAGEVGHRGPRLVCGLAPHLARRWFIGDTFVFPSLLQIHARARGATVRGPSESSREFRAQPIAHSYATSGARTRDRNAASVVSPRGRRVCEIDD